METLDTIINRINQKWGHQTIRSARQMNKPAATHIKTGFAALDALFSGIPQGHVTEIAGRATSGLTTFSHHIAAQAQHSKQNVVYVQLNNPLDGQHITHCGVQFDQMIAVDVESIPIALDVTRSVINSGAVGLIIVNLMASRERHIDLQRLLLDLRGSGCALLLLLPSFARSNGASLRLNVQRRKWLRETHQLVGCLSSVSIQRNRFGAVGQDVMLLMRLVQDAWA